MEEMQMDINALRNVILDEGEIGQNLILKSNDERERLNNLGIKTQRETQINKTRRTTFINSALSQMHSNINEKDVLDKDQETHYLKVVEALVSGKTKQVGTEETKALVAIKREYQRRQMTIAAVFKENAWLDKQLVQIDGENDVLTQTIIDQYEYNQALNNLVSQLKRQINEMEFKTGVA